MNAALISLAIYSVPYVRLLGHLNPYGQLLEQKELLDQLQILKEQQKHKHDL